MSDDTKGFKLLRKKLASDASSGGLSLPQAKNVRQRWLIVGVGGMLVLGAASSLLTENQPQRTQKEKPVGMVDVTPKVAEERAFTAVYGRDLEFLKTRVDQLAQSSQADKRTIEELRAELKTAKEAQASAPSKTDSTNPLGGPLGGDAPPAPPVPSPKLTGGMALPPTVPATGTAAPLPSPVVRDTKPMEFQGPAAGDASKVDATVAYQKNENAGKVSLGFASITLLTGLDAGTSQATQSNPLPVLFRINSHAQLPGLAQYKMEGCFGLGTGYGDLSAERVYIRAAKLSCTDKRTGMMLSAEISGAIADSDGTLGLRGKYEDRQGARLHKAILAGFAQGLAGALGTAQATTSTSSLTGAVTSSLTGSAALRQSGLAGAQTAASQLAEFYLKEAQNIFPVVVVENGRTGTLLLTGDAKLEWVSTKDKYVQQVTPNNKRN